MDSLGLGYNPDTENHVFPELLKFNILTKKWSKVFTSGDDKMPKESVSNAVAMKNDVLVVCLAGPISWPNQYENCMKKMVIFVCLFSAIWWYWLSIWR